MRERLLKITEFANIANTNRKTLQYYDEIGLFSPAFVSNNGYRYYSLLQLDQLALIAVLRDLGFPLKEIKRYQECGAVEELNRLLEKQSMEIDRSIELLQRRKAMLADVLTENRAFQKYGGKGFQILFWENERISRLTSADRQSPFVINYLTDGLHTGLCFWGEEHFFYQKQEDGDISIAGGKYLCIYDRSDDPVQKWLADTTAAMIRYAEGNDLELDNRFYAEFNDMALDRNGQRQFFLRMIRAKIL